MLRCTLFSTSGSRSWEQLLKTLKSSLSAHKRISGIISKSWTVSCCCYFKYLSLSSNYPWYECSPSSVIISTHFLTVVRMTEQSLSRSPMSRCHPHLPPDWSESHYRVIVIDNIVITDLQKVKKKPIPASEAESLVKKLKLKGYKECSAFTQDGLKDVFDEALIIALDPPTKYSQRSICGCVIIWDQKKNDIEVDLWIKITFLNI